MSFDRIGPYELTRGDLIAAAIVISFLTGAGAARWPPMVAAACGLLLFGGGLALGHPWIAAWGISLILLMFVIAPALRSRKGAREIYLQHAADGLVAETPNIRTTYKWNTIRTARKVGSRLFVMINDGHALVISDRSTSPENMRRLIATVEAHMASAAA